MSLINDKILTSYVKILKMNFKLPTILSNEKETILTPNHIFKYGMDSLCPTLQNLHNLCPMNSIWRPPKCECHLHLPSLNLYLITRYMLCCPTEHTIQHRFISAILRLVILAPKS